MLRGDHQIPESPKSPIEQAQRSRSIFGSMDRNASPVALQGIPEHFNQLYLIVHEILKAHSAELTLADIERYIVARWPVFSGFQNGEFLSDIRYSADGSALDLEADIDDAARKVGRACAAKVVQSMSARGPSRKRGPGLQDITNTPGAPREKTSKMEDALTQDRYEIKAPLREAEEAEQQADALSAMVDPDVFYAISQPTDADLPSYASEVPQDDEDDEEQILALFAAQEAEQRAIEAAQQADALSAMVDPDVLDPVSQQQAVEQRQPMLASEQHYRLPDGIDPEIDYEVAGYITEVDLAERQAFEALASEQQEKASFLEKVDPEVLNAISQPTDAELPAYASEVPQDDEDQVLALFAAQEAEQRAAEAEGQQVDALSAMVDPDVFYAMSQQPAVEQRQPMLASEQHYPLPNDIDPRIDYEVIGHMAEVDLAERKECEALASEQQEKASFLEKVDPDVFDAMSQPTDAELPSYASEVPQDDEEQVLALFAVQEAEQCAAEAEGQQVDALSVMVDPEVFYAMSQPDFRNSAIPQKALGAAESHSSRDDVQPVSSSQEASSGQSTDADQVMEAEPIAMGLGQKTDSNSTKANRASTAVESEDKPLSSKALQAIFGVVDLSLDGMLIDMTEDQESHDEEASEQARFGVSPAY